MNMNIQSNNGYFYSSLLYKMFLLAESNTIIILFGFKMLFVQLVHLKNFV